MGIEESPDSGEVFQYRMHGEPRETFSLRAAARRAIAGANIPPIEHSSEGLAPPPVRDTLRLRSARIGKKLHGGNETD